MLQGTTEDDEAMRNMSGQDVPSITEEADGGITMRLPLYHTRRKLVAQDARSVVAAYIGSPFVLMAVFVPGSCFVVRTPCSFAHRNPPLTLVVQQDRKKKLAAGAAGWGVFYRRF